MIIYDEPAEVYHANEADGSTDARAFMISPRLYRDIKDGLAIKETAALFFGTTSHMSLLEPARFASTVAIKPHGMNFATTEGKLWKAKMQAAGKMIVKEEDADHLAGMHARMPAEVRSIFAACKPEVTIRTTLRGLPVQCRIDLFSPTNYDLKSIDNIDHIEKSIHQRGYHIQKRWYQRVHAEEINGNPAPFLFLFAEKNPPYRWRIVDLDADYDAIADDAIDAALHGIVARNKSGCWDDPGNLHLTASPPQWMAGELVEDEAGISL